MLGSDLDPLLELVFTFLAMMQPTQLWDVDDEDKL
jgi:hypothetical protein